MSNQQKKLKKRLQSAEKEIKDLEVELEETNRGMVSLALELEKTKERYEDIFRNAIEGIFQISPDGKHFLLVNSSLANMLGYNSPEEVKERIKNIPEEVFVDTDKYEKLLRILEEEKEVIKEEFKIRRKDDKEIWVMLNQFLVTREHNGYLRYYEGTIIDIDQRKKYEEQNEQLLDLFGKFVPREFIRYLSSDGLADIKLGDQIEESIAIFYADIHGFTSISESISTENNFKLLNAFLKRIGPCIRSNNGFIDKYLGDGVMALFPNKPSDAVEASLEMKKIIHCYNEERMAHNREPIHFSIGLNYGTVQLGIIGDDNRYNVTVISDDVNQTFRIEGLAKEYDAPLLISEELYERLDIKDKFHFRQLGRLNVKGREDPVTIFEIIDGDLRPQGELKGELKEPFNKGIQKYFEGQYADASHKLSQVLKENPDDKAAKIYLNKATSEISN